MDFTARLSRVNSRPSRGDDSRFVTNIVLECHDLSEAGILTTLLGQAVEVRLDSVPTPMSPMERAINETLARTPVVSAEREVANERVVEAEAEDDGFSPVDDAASPNGTSNGTTAIEHVTTPGTRRRRR